MMMIGSFKGIQLVTFALLILLLDRVSGNGQGLKKVTKVRKGLAVQLNETHFTQELTWDEVVSEHQTIANYSIQYKQAENNSTGSIQTSQVAMANLTLLLPTSPITYNVCVAAVGEKTGLGNYSKVLKLTYTAPGKPKSLSIKMLTCNKLKVTWSQPNDCGGLPQEIISYDVSYGSDSMCTKAQRTAATLVMLIPGTEYNIKVRAKNTAGSSGYIMRNRKTNNRTQSRLMVLATSNTSFELLREPPEKTYQCWVNGTQPEGDGYIFNNSTLQIGGLALDTPYSIGCVEVDSDDQYACTEYNTTVLTGLNKVTNISMGLAAGLNETYYTQEIKWEEVVSDHQTIANYSIQYKQAANNSTSNIQTSQIAMANLTLPLPTSPTTYNVWVAAVGEETGVGEYSQVLMINLSEPDTPKDLTAVARACNKLELMWSIPDNTGGLPIVSYEVEYGIKSGKGMIKNTSDTSIYLTDLIPKTMYTVQVRATTPITGEYSTTSTTTLNRNAARQITATPVLSTTIQLQNNRNTMYHCWVNTTQSGSNNTYKLDEKQWKQVRNLLPNTMYGIGCVEVADNGQYQCTEYNDTVLTGLEQVSNLIAIKVERVNSTHYNQSLSWDVVMSEYQATSNYSIKHGNATSVHDINSTGVSTATSIQTTAALTLPLPTSLTTYNVWVAAVGNKTGVGQYSQALMINLSEPDTPKNLTVVTRACNKLELVWSKPDNTGGLPIVNYEVKYGIKSGEGMMNLTTNYNHTFNELANLVPRTTYTIKVRTKTSLNSKYSIINATTLNRTQIHMISVNRTSDSVKMLKLSSQSEKNYTCWVNNTNHILEAMNIIVLNTLEYDSSYSIGCVETDDRNLQCTEYNTTVLTGLGPIQRVRKQSAMKVDNMTFQQTIKWGSRRSKHQNISHYSIRYGDSSKVSNYTSTRVKNITSTVNLANLTALPLPTSPTTYNVWVAAVGEKTGVGEYSQVLQIEYKEPGRPEALKISMVKCNQLKVSWKNPQSNGGLPIDGYQLQYSTKSGPPVVLNVSHTTTSAVLSHLLPGTMYTIKVKAVHSINGSNYAEISKDTDNRTTVRMITAIETSDTTIEVSSGKKKPYRCRTNETNTNNTFVLTESNKMHGLRELTPDTVYSIDCVEVNNNGSYQCTEYNTTVLTGLPQPKNLTIGWVQTLSRTNFQQEVNWEEVQSEHQTIKNYSIKYGPSPKVSMYNSTGVQTRKSTTNKTILHLQLPTSPTTYNVWVAAVGEKTGIGEYSKVLQINYSAPQSPQNLSISEKCNELAMAWIAPEDTGGLQIANYKIQYKTDRGNLTSLTTNSTTTNITLRNLLPGTSYNIEVRVNNSIEGTAVASRVTTHKRMNISTISIQLKGNTGIKIIKTCQTCTKSYKCWINGAKYNNLVKILNQTQRTVNGLKPDTSYTIGCVEVYNNGWYGCTEFNRTVTIGVPKAQGLRKSGKVTFNGTHISQRIEWDNVKSNTQNITHFIVKYGRSRWVKTYNSTKAQKVRSNESTVTLNLFIPRQRISYNVWVTTVGNKTGPGEYSDVLKIDYTAPDAPKDLNVTNITCNTITVEWTKQEVSGGLPVTGYEVMILKGGETAYNHTVKPALKPTSNKKLLDEGIEPNMPYQVQLKAINHIGTGNSAKTTVMKTFAKDDLQLQFIPRSSTWASLIITPPDTIHKDNTNYSCNISSMDKHFMVNRSDHSITLEMLTPNSTYSVHCLVYRDNKELCYEGTANASTFPSVPERVPSNVTLIQTTSHEFTMEWDTPEGYELNQDIAGYKVEYWTATEGGMNDTEYVANTTSYTATELDAGTVYIFQVAAFTANGTGVYSDPVTISTIPTVENITISNIANTSAEVIWGELFDDYSIWLEITINDNFMYGNTSFLQINTTNTTKYHIRNRDPYREYTIEMYLQFGNLGNGSRENVSFRTLGTAPSEPPTNTTVETGKKNATLQWGIPLPRGRNGIITSYIIEWKGGAQQTSPQTSLQLSRQISPINHTVSQRNFTYPEHQTRTLENLYPYTNYTWRVAAVNINGSGLFSMWSNFTTEEDVPEQVEELMVIEETNSTIIVNWTEPDVPNGVIIEYEVCYWRLGNNCTKPILLNNTDMSEVSIQELEPGVPYKIRVTAFTSAGRGEENTYSEAIFTEELPPTETVTNITIQWTSATSVNISWAPLTLHQARGFPLYVVNITTKGRVVKNLTTNQTNVKVNELNRNTVYFVTVKPLTRGGDLEGETSEQLTFGTEPPQITEYIPIIAGAAGGLAVIVLLCIVLCIAVKVCCRSKTKQRKEEDIPLEYMNAQDNDDRVNSIQRKTPIPREGFCEYVKNMHKSKNKHFITEFSSILQHPNSTHTAAENNPQKNRYINIYPYDVSRVILMAHDGTDYINGAYVDGYSRPKAYIACQGPITTTIADFWQMIWEHKSTIIVMLTRLVEGDRPKCVQYWSEELNVAFEPGRDLVITTARIDTAPSYEVRHFEVRKTSEKADPLKVKHFLYTAWPDHGVPQYTSSMVKFILDQIKPDMKSNTAPIIVHCSAGAGRTGTFIAIDTTLDRLEEENTINIFECVEIMRTRRTQMVQNVNQYMYAHDAINDHVTCGDTYIVAHELGQKLSEMAKTKPGAEKTGFQEQFEILEKLSPEFSESDQNFAFNPKAVGKIRYVDRFTYSENYIETENEEHYVNATHIKGYYGQSGFIAAQAPMKSTIEDTWFVIREQECRVAVVLCELKEEEEKAESETSCIHFCPQEPGKTLSTENITVTALKAEETDGYTITEVSSIEEDEEPTITTLYHYKAWKKDGRPDVPSLLKLMGDVQRSHQGSRGPLMVMCDDGMSRTGVFITVMSEIDRVKVEGEMDIFHTVKAARTDRPHMVSTVLDYEVCHEIIHNYLESFDTYANFK